MSRQPKLHEPIKMNFGDVLCAIADEKKPKNQTITTRPFLKWVGGKRSILSFLIEKMPEQYGVYREPFIGGGALFFAVQPTRASLSDLNFHLMLTYKILRDDLEGLIKILKIHQSKHSKEYYLKARQKLSTETEAVKIAALFIYINKTCYNGLYRVNKAGFFNVPIGSYKNPVIFDEEILCNDSAILQGISIGQRHFSQVGIGREDFFYLDPPYHQTYSNYNGNGFNEDEHKKLAALCHEIDKSKAYFMLSNSDTPFIRSLYKSFHIELIKASRSVSCKSYQRGKENELIIRNYQ